MAQIILDEGAAPGTPSASKVAIYAKSDGLMYSKDDAGLETLMSSGTSAPGWNFQGANTTEATTTSTTAVDLVTISSLSIAATAPIVIVAFVRRSSTGAGQQGRLGLKINATEVLAPLVIGTASTSASYAIVHWWIPPFHADYRGQQMSDLIGAGGSTGSWYVYPLTDVNRPNAIITDIIIRASVTDASLTLGVKDVMVYTLRQS